MSVEFWVISGTGSLGLAIGWLVWTFVKRAPTFTITALGSVATIAAGGSLLALWKHTDTGGLTKEANSYFIGLIISILILGMLNYDPPPEISSASEKESK